jgi:hypothetical protein
VELVEGYLGISRYCCSILHVFRCLHDSLFSENLVFLKKLISFNLRSRVPSKSSQILKYYNLKIMKILAKILGLTPNVKKYCLRVKEKVSYKHYLPSAAQQRQYLKLNFHPVVQIKRPRRGHCRFLPTKAPSTT